MKILIDMNLSPGWVEVFARYDYHAVHWSSIGDPAVADSVIMKWAKTNNYLVFTHDLDFGTLLAVTHANGPSVIQVRTQDVMPEILGDRVAQILIRHEPMLEKGALITIDEAQERIRILPF